MTRADDERATRLALTLLGQLGLDEPILTEIVAVLTAVRLEEREACARVADGFATDRTDLVATGIRGRARREEQEQST